MKKVRGEFEPRFNPGSNSRVRVEGGKENINIENLGSTQVYPRFNPGSTMFKPRFNPHSTWVLFDFVEPGLEMM